MGLPGTGLFYTSREALHSGYHSAATDAQATSAQRREHARHVERVLLLVLAAFLVLAYLVSQ